MLIIDPSEDISPEVHPVCNLELKETNEYKIDNNWWVRNADTNLLIMNYAVVFVFILVAMFALDVSAFGGGWGIGGYGGAFGTFNGYPPQGRAFQRYGGLSGADDR